MYVVYKSFVWGPLKLVFKECIIKNQQTPIIYQDQPDNIALFPLSCIDKSNYVLTAGFAFDILSCVWEHTFSMMGIWLRKCIGGDCHRYTMQSFNLYSIVLLIRQELIK